MDEHADTPAFTGDPMTLILGMMCGVYYLMFVIVSFVSHIDHKRIAQTECAQIGGTLSVVGSWKDRSYYCAQDPSTPAPTERND